MRPPETDRSACSAQLISNAIALRRGVTLGGQFFAKQLGGFVALTAGFVHRGLGYFDINDSGFDELTPFECVHRMNPWQATDKLLLRNLS